MQTLQFAEAPIITRGTSISHMRTSQRDAQIAQKIEKTKQRQTNDYPSLVSSCGALFLSLEKVARELLESTRLAPTVVQHKHDALI